jgi:hypothetical protein
MALTNDTQLTNLSKAVLAANASYLTPDSDPNSAYGVSVTKMKEFLRQVMSYITVGGTGLGSGAEVLTNLGIASPSDLTVLVAGAPVPVLSSSLSGAAVKASASGTIA